MGLQVLLMVLPFCFTLFAWKFLAKNAFIMFDSSIIDQIQNKFENQTTRVFWTKINPEMLIADIIKQRNKFKYHS